MRWPPDAILAPLCAELGLAAPIPDDDAPVEQRLGQAHERALGKTRRGRGAYYTPPAVVEYLIEHTLGAWLAARCPEEGSRLRVLDPACGAGAFLAPAYRHLLQHHAELAGRPPDLGERLRILREQIHGVDIDPQAVRLCRLVLGLVALEQDAPAQLTPSHLNTLVDLTENVRCSDALDSPAPPDGRGRQESAVSLAWRELFPRVLDGPAGGFDVILANPPHLGGVQRHTRLPAARLASLRRAYASARGTIDVSVLFQELALRLLAPAGRAGLLVPNKFLSAPFGAAFRDLASSQSELRLLADLSEARIFPGAATYPVIYVLEARRPRQSYPVEVHRFAQVRGALRLASRRQKSMEAGDGSWALLLSDGGALVQRLQARFPPLASRYTVRAAATPEEAYRLRDALREGRPDEPAFQFLTSGAILRYGHRHGTPQRYLGARLMAPYLPRASA